MITIKLGKERVIETVVRKYTPKEIYSILLSYLRVCYIEGKINSEQYKTCKGEFRRSLYNHSKYVDFKNGNSKGAYKFLSKNFKELDEYYSAIMNKNILYAEIISKDTPYIFVDDKSASITINEN